MLDPRLLYSFDPEHWSALAGQRPVLIHMLDGYMDAGLVGRSVGDFLLEKYATDVMVTFDVDQLHDWRSRRPTMVFDSSRWASFTGFHLDLHVCKDRSGTEFLLLRGAEPDMQWERMVSALNHIVNHVDARLVLTASGAPMAVPHTRPSLVTEHTTDAQATVKNPPVIDRIEVPGSFSAFWELALSTRQRRAGGFAVHVPHYLAQAPFLQAAAEGLRRIVAASGLDLEQSAFDNSAAENLNEINAEMSNSSEVAEVVAALEAQYDEAATNPGALPSADEIGAEFEKFLAEQDDESEQ